MAVLLPPLKTLALGRAVDVHGSHDAAATLVEELPRRRILLRRRQDIVSDGYQAFKSPTKWLQRVSAAMAALHLNELAVNAICRPQSDVPVPLTIPGTAKHQL